MIKYLKYILYIFCLIGCFEINKPFENDKITMPDIKAINSGLYTLDDTGNLHVDIKKAYESPESKALLLDILK